MKVLHIITGLAVGGAEGMLKRLALADTATHRIVSLRGINEIGKELLAGGVDVRALGMSGVRPTISGLARLVREIRRDPPDVVQTWLYHGDLIGGLAARMAGVRAIAWGVRTADIRTGISLSRGAKIALRVCARLSGRVPARIVYVAEAAKRVHEAAGYDPAKSIVIQNGYDIPPAADRPATAAAVREELGIDADALLIGTVGTFSFQKNQTGFVAACGILCERFPTARIVLIGRGNTADNADLRAAIEQTGCADRFVLLGQRSDVQRLLAALDIFCLNSRGEGFPNVVGEAMAAGTPCVVTDVGDAALLVSDTGIVVAPQDPPQLLAALTELAQATPAERAHRGDRGRARIADHFAIDIIRDRYASLYRALVAGEHQRGPG